MGSPKVKKGRSGGARQHRTSHCLQFRGQIGLATDRPMLERSKARRSINEKWEEAPSCKQRLEKVECSHSWQPKMISVSPEPTRPKETMVVCPNRGGQQMLAFLLISLRISMPTPKRVPPKKHTPNKAPLSCNWDIAREPSRALCDAPTRPCRLQIALQWRVWVWGWGGEREGRGGEGLREWGGHNFLTFNEILFGASCRREGAPKPSCSEPCVWELALSQSAHSMHIVDSNKQYNIVHKQEPTGKSGRSEIAM